MRARGVSYVVSEENLWVPLGIFYILPQRVYLLSQESSLRGLKREFSMKVQIESSQKRAFKRESTERVLNEHSKRVLNREFSKESSR